MADDALTDFERTTFTHDGTTRDVFRLGSGPAPGGRPDLRFTSDRLVPSERFRFLERELGDAFCAIELDDDAAAESKFPPHSVVTEHLVDEPGQPARSALDEVLELFRSRLLV